MHFRLLVAVLVMGSAVAFVLVDRGLQGQGVPKPNQRGQWNPADAARPEAKKVTGPLVPRPVEVPAPADPWVEVDWGLKLDPDTRALYERMAILVSGYTAVPEGRRHYYSAIIDCVAGWGGLLSDVRSAAGGGYVVTVSAVSPDIAPGALFGSRTCIDPAGYSETFHVDAKNNVTFLGFSDPYGMAGEMPSMGF